MRGLGTLINVAAVLAGSSIGVFIGDRLPRRTRDVVTDGVALVALMVAVLDGASVLDPALRAATGPSAPVLIVLGSVLIGGIAGSLLRIEGRLDSIGAVLQRRLSRTGRAQDMAIHDEPGPEADRARFVEGFVTASLVFCVGPLTIIGSLQDGLGQGYSQLALKSVLDGFTSIAFAASLGWGVAAAALSVLLVQGSLTAAAAALGGLIPVAGIDALTATGGLLLAGVGLRLLRVRAVPVADLLPALVVAPLLTAAIHGVR